MQPALKRTLFIYFITVVILHNHAIAKQFPDFQLNTLLDARMVATDDAISSFDAGLGKTRFGGDNNNNQIQLTIAEASAVFKSRFSLSTTGKLHLKADPEQTNSIDIVEAFITYRPVPRSATRIKSRVGIFFPPISFENRQLAWTSPYSISSSAINSWVGDELRTLGAEITATHLINDERFSLTGAIYRANDPTGSLLAWRGWALHSRKSGLFDRLPLAPLPSIEAGGSIEAQASWVEPFQEIDRRTGFYAAVDWKHMNIGQLKIMRYDNRAKETAFDGNQYAWHTRFTSIGGRYEFVNGFELLAQILKGDSAMGRQPNGRLVVDIDMQAAYVLLSKHYNQHRVSFRYDKFRIKDLDDMPDDNNNEDGSAISLSYSHKLTKSQRFLLEVMQINSNRANRSTLSLNTSVTENTLQLSYRLAF